MLDLLALTASAFQSTLPARGATRPRNNKRQGFRISIHAPRTGSDNIRKANLLQSCLISIHAPRTGSDHTIQRGSYGAEYFNPRSPHGERPTQPSADHMALDISIHAPRTGSDPQRLLGAQTGFQISIHAPRTGSDVNVSYIVLMSVYISIHAPRTGSDASYVRIGDSSTIFQSTLPARGATTCAFINKE